ncbi:MAG: hypothetical protein ACTHXA_09985 [Gulosibacter sp.]|uniref:hypothetical protein n=1 Tax=Gulosibacter sp. TaxID=2817531 RepID=UPI003F924FE5
MRWTGNRAGRDANRGRLGWPGVLALLAIPVPAIACWSIVFVGTPSAEEPASPQLRVIMLGLALLLTAVWLLLLTPVFPERVTRLLTLPSLVMLFGGFALIGVGFLWMAVERLVTAEGDAGENVMFIVFGILIMAIPLLFLFRRRIPGTDAYRGGRSRDQPR